MWEEIWKVFFLLFVFFYKQMSYHTGKEITFFMAISLYFLKISSIQGKQWNMASMWSVHQEEKVLVILTLWILVIKVCFFTLPKRDCCVNERFACEQPFNLHLQIGRHPDIATTPDLVWNGFQISWFSVDTGTWPLSRFSLWPLILTERAASCLQS